MLCSWRSRRYAVPSIYRAATPQGAVIVTQTIMKQRRGDEEKTEAVFSSAVYLINSLHLEAEKCAAD